MSNQLVKEFTGTVPDKSQFASLKEALVWINGLMGEGLPVIMSVIANDLFASSRGKNRSLHVLGVHSKAEALCKRLAPGYKWNIHVYKNHSGQYQFMAWYDSYTPYAVAMMEAEDGFECKGIEFESIVGYYKTCMGFVSVAEHVNDEHRQLYFDIYNACNRVRPPSLPFSEVHFPAVVFSCLKAPRRWSKNYKNVDHWSFSKTAEVLEELKLPIPKHLAKALKR